MSLLTVHPRFFTTLSASENHNVQVSQGDASIDTLYNLYMSRSVNTASWSFRQQVLAQALRLFGNFSDWLEHQRNSPSVTGFNREFLEDTVNYIQTGQRKMLILNWIELMDEVDARERPAVAHASVVSMSNSKTVQVLQAWCAHTDGIEDLVQTLYVLFGHKHRPN